MHPDLSGVGPLGGVKKQMTQIDKLEINFEKISFNV
jgi:hypothetical protein